MKVVTDRPQCDCCADHAPTIDLGYVHAYDGAGIEICEPCLRKALALFGWRSLADGPRVITRVMDDGIETKDGAA